MNGARRFLSDFLFVLGDARRQLPGIFTLFLFAALLDLCGLGMIFPLITAITTPGTAALEVIKIPFVDGPLDVKLVAGCVVVAYVCRGLVAYRVQRTIARFSEGQRGKLMTRLLDAYLRKPYEFHLQRNSAILINNTLNLTWGFTAGVLSALMRLATDLVTFAAILAFLAWANWQAVAVAVSVLTAVLTVYNRLAKRTLASSGEIVAASQANAVRTLNHALGALREVRVLGIEQHSVEEMQRHASRLAEAAGTSGALMAIPRYLIETSLIVILASMAVLLHTHASLKPDLIPTLGLFAIAAIRLMPGTTSIIGSVNAIRANRYALRQLADDLRIAEVNLDRPLRPAGTEAVPSPFRGFKTIEFAHVTYRYPNSSQPALRDVCLKIRAGQAIGIVGRSGAGKSTLADVLLGLILPQSGQILVDGKSIHADPRAWMNELAYIPQTVFINDDTLRANIAFGIPADRVDDSRVAAAVASSQLEEVVRNLPAGLGTMLGERGVRLSGGQRQRVALARALYHDRQLIVMDEATAALDTETEREVIRAIQTLHGSKTLIIIAHRHSTIAGCDFVVSVSGGRASVEGVAERAEPLAGHDSGMPDVTEAGR